MMRCWFPLLAVVWLTTVTAAPRPGVAELLDEASSVAAADPPPAQPAAPDEALWTARFYWENDGTVAKPNNASDRHRSNAIGFSVAVIPTWHETLAEALPFARSFDADAAALGGVIGQVLYTPADLTVPAVIPGDRPYAGHLFGGVFVQRVNDFDRDQPAGHDPTGLLGWSTFDHAQLNVGVLGPEALGEETQRDVHEVFDEIDPKGWDNQLDEGVQVQGYLRKAWRYHGQIDGAFGFDLIPDAGLALGTTFRHAEAGLTGRIGLNLPANFGEGELMRLTAFTAPPPRGWMVYGYARGSGRVVQYNATIDEGPTGIESETLVGRFRAGLAAGYRSDRWNVQVGYSQTFMSEDYRQQRGADSYGLWTVALHGSF